MINVLKLSIMLVNTRGTAIFLMPDWFWVDTWEDMYKNDLTQNFTGKQLQGVLGGEACMW